MVTRNLQKVIPPGFVIEPKDKLNLQRNANDFYIRDLRFPRRGRFESICPRL